MLYTTLTINGQTYDKPALVELINNKADLPAWQQSCYQFIKDWLSEEKYVWRNSGWSIVLK